MTTKEIVLEGGPPWGFRMHGDGAAGTPFRISRVNPGSLSAECGLREGELVLRIGGVPAATLSTAQAHQLMREAGGRMELTVAAREMPSPRISRKQSAPAAVPAPPPPPPPPPVRPPPPAPATARHGSPSAARKDTVRPTAPVLQGSPGAVRKDPVSVPGAVPSVGPRRSPARSPSPARAAVDGLQRSGSQEELNAAFERLAMGAVAQQQQQQQQQQPQQQPPTPPPARRMVALSRSRSLDKPPGMQRHIVNGDASQSAGDSQGVTSPLPPPSPKSLSRSPSLRRKGVWQPGSTPPSTPSQPEVKPKREDGPLIKDPVWTPKSSPTLERKQYRPINYDSNSLERKKKAQLPSPPPPPPSEWDAPERVTVPVRSSSLPRPESATVTLLREARQGHLPRGAQYLSTVDGGRVVPPRRAPPVKEVEGVGPTTTGGMPVALRSTVKGENRQDWYRRVYDNLHRQPQARSSYGLGGYSSEPDAGYEDELNPRVPSRQPAERYRGQPGRIEDYTPGQSSLAEQEAAKYWEEVMGYFDKFLDDHAHIRLERPLRGVRSAANQAAPPGNNSNYVPRGLDGYESDSTLVYHRNEPPALTSGEQRSYYNQIQRGGEVPLSGLRKPAPERPKAAGPRYQEAAVNIHYRSPVRWEEKEPLSEDELRRRQEDTMRRAYEEARRRKEERQAEDRESRRHGDNFTPSQKSPIPLDRYERLFDDVTDDRRPTLTASVLHEFRAQNNRELSLSRGETVRIRRKIDSNWYEGQKGTRIGIFPVTYVQVIDPRERSADRWSSRPQVRAKHRFSAQSAMELSLNKGDVVTILRRVDDNWYEGRRGDATGIFPASYVEPLTADHSDGGPRQKPVGAPAAHGLVMDGLSLRAPGERDQLRVDVKQNTMLYRVMFPYRHQNEDELDLEEGDMIQVLEQCPDGWYVGTNMRTGMFGTFPGNYTRRM